MMSVSQIDESTSSSRMKGSLHLEINIANTQKNCHFLARRIENVMQFEKAKAAGAAMTEAEMSWAASMPKLMP